MRRLLACALLIASHGASARAQPAPAPAAPAPPPSPAAAPPQASPEAAAPVPDPSTTTPGSDPATTPPATAPAAPAAEPETPELASARQHFLQGVAFADAGNCSAAIVEFEAAYKIVPRPNALYNIAQCQERLFRYDLAIRYYERYLREAPPDASDRPAVEAALRTLGNLLGILHVKSNVRAEVWVDDRLAGQAPGSVFVPAGGHSVEVRADGYIPKRTEVRLVGRQEVDVDFQLVKAQTTVQVTETTGLDPTLFWIGAGATAVTAAVGGIFALQVVSLRDEALELPEVHPDRTLRREEVEDAELTADIFFASAALLAVGTTIVFFVTDWDADSRALDDEAIDPEPVVRVAPVIAPGVAGMQIGGRL